MVKPYPIGTPGQKWGDAEKRAWLAAQNYQRSYQEEVLAKLRYIPEGFELHQYGQLAYKTRYPLYCAKPKQWLANKPAVLVTGGVHGYETSGVQGAIQFLLNQASSYLEKANVVVAPCISPWGYETINRWNPDAVDPNRSFANETAPESVALKRLVESFGCDWLMHIDLHETTDTDNTEFRPALAARDGTQHPLWEIPDGFYLVGDSAKPQPGFQQAMIQAVQQVTHIAPPDENGCIIGAPITQAGVINYDIAPLGLCASVTGAEYVSTTEVYPDSPKVDDQNCNDAQVAAITAGLDYVLNQN